MIQFSQLTFPCEVLTNFQRLLSQSLLLCRKTCLLFYYPISIKTYYLYKSTSFTATCTSFVPQPFHWILTSKPLYTHIQLTAQLTNLAPSASVSYFNDTTQYYWYIIHRLRVSQCYLFTILNVPTSTTDYYASSTSETWRAQVLRHKTKTWQEQLVCLEESYWWLHEIEDCMALSLAWILSQPPRISQLLLLWEQLL